MFIPQETACALSTKSLRRGGFKFEYTARERGLAAMELKATTSKAKGAAEDWTPKATGSMLMGVSKTGGVPVWT